MHDGVTLKQYNISEVRESCKNERRENNLLQRQIKKKMAEERL